MAHNLTVQIPAEMMDALKEAARSNFTSISAQVRQALDQHLERRGINWRREEHPRV